jgi:phospholipase A1/A2
MTRTAAAGHLPALLLLLLFASWPPPNCAADEPEGNFQIIQAGNRLTQHKEMFLLPYTYSDVYRGWRTEAIFQLSAKYSLFNTRFYVAYTQISFWQSYDYRNSSPLRDTNYNPEIFYRFKPFAYQSGQFGADAGLEHESNGQPVPLSRSWNLAYVAPWFRHGDLLLCVKLRNRFPEDPKPTPDSAVGDDNPDITNYLGYSDLHVYYRFASAHQIHVTMRGVIGSSGKGNVSAAYSLPLPRDKGSYLLLRLFHGYGESLMDYRRSINRVGIGFMFTR